MRLRWTAPAAQDLYSITHFVRRDKPAAARDVAKTIYERCESLRYSPLRGRKGKRTGTSELVLSPQRYIAANDHIFGARLYPVVDAHRCELMAVG